MGSNGGGVWVTSSSTQSATVLLPLFVLCPGIFPRIGEHSYPPNGERSREQDRHRQNKANSSSDIPDKVLLVCAKSLFTMRMAEGLSVSFFWKNIENIAKFALLYSKSVL